MIEFSEIIEFISNSNAVEKQQKNMLINELRLFYSQRLDSLFSDLSKIIPTELFIQFRAQILESDLKGINHLNNL